MIERLKRKLRHNDDHGSSFVLVIVATTFMCILASAILMGAMMTYKLKFYKLNSLNNFYEVETALDEMYAGVGAATNEHLYSAYTTTAELVVVYDTKAQAYTTLDNKSANELFKKLFMTGFVADTNYKSLKNVTDTLQSFISNEYDAVDNPDGVRLDTSNMKLIYTDVNNKTTTQYYKNNGGIKTEKQSGYENDKVQSVTFKNVCVKRSVDLQGSTAGTYEQSITTDIVLTEPEYNVSFDTSSVASNTLYEYAILADMGVEPYLIADSLVGIIAQRLVRRLCECKKPRLATAEEKEELAVDPSEDIVLYEPCGCKMCDNTGYKGRIGIYEIMTITPKIKSMIARGKSADEIKEQAIEEGMSTLKASAAKYVLDGTTSMSEMVKVTYEVEK